MATYSLWGAGIPHVHKYFSIFTSKERERQSQKFLQWIYFNIHDLWHKKYSTLPLTIMCPCLIFYAKFP